MPIKLSYQLTRNLTTSDITTISWVDNTIYRHLESAFMKDETDIIARITSSSTGNAVMLVIMNVQIFKTDIIVLNGDVTMCLMLL